MTNYVIASIGASGSRMIRDAIKAASGRDHVNDDYPGDWRGKVLHTHAPYSDVSKKLGRNWRAVFVYGHIGDAICTFYEERNSSAVGLRLMGVDDEHRAEFTEMVEIDKLDAWLYIVEDDKLRWRENILSWTTAPNTLPVIYEAVRLEPKRLARTIGDFLDLDVVLPEITPRVSDWRRLPRELQFAIQAEYDDMLVISDALRRYERIIGALE